ncbi:hypothetical protein [Flavobacterium sp.]|uniref:hypothetical protein n=1 Tax=Flavobacterium sp. TaxID=239 RepID=UPI0022BDF74E|nr:hypothetical protein [Flavobacterium sp.]MCZ8228582.1 hypothetical protein [Flavobacterium sp.]
MVSLYASKYNNNPFQKSIKAVSFQLTIPSKVLVSYCPSPDCNGKPGAHKANFSCPKRATNGSSFWGVEKWLWVRGLVMKSGNSS